MKFFGFLSQQKPAWIAASNFISIFLFSLCAFLEMEGRSFEACLLLLLRPAWPYCMVHVYRWSGVFSECCESAWVKWDYLPLKKYPHHFLCKDQQSQNLHETGRSSEHDLKSKRDLGFLCKTHIRLLENLWRKAGFETMWAMSFKSRFGFVSIAHAIAGTCCCKHCQGKRLVGPVWQAPY